MTGWRFPALGDVKPLNDGLPPAMAHLDREPLGQVDLAASHPKILFGLAFVFSRMGMLSILEQAKVFLGIQWRRY